MEAAAGDIPRFGVVAGEPSDHLYRSRTDIGNLSFATTNKIMLEWSVLQSNLPDSIFVRVYESRITLLRAAIVGGKGTPYQDNLFFFDIALPDDYPSRPPSVRYHSFGSSINPCFLQGGYVHRGHRSQKWNPKQSTLLQVLVSIQVLLQDEKPFFNESGMYWYKGYKEWEEKSAAYGRSAFVLSCESALHLMRRPPERFEALVTAHYRERGLAILSACEVERKRGVLEIEKVCGELIEAFARKGVPVKDFVERLGREKEKEARMQEAKGKKREEEERKREEKWMQLKQVRDMMEKNWKQVRDAIGKKVGWIWDTVWARTN